MKLSKKFSHRNLDGMFRLTLFRMGIFGTAHGWEAKKPSPP